MNRDRRDWEAPRFRVGALLETPDETGAPLTPDKLAAFERALGGSRKTAMPKIAFGTLAACAAVLLAWWAARAPSMPSVLYQASPSLSSSDEAHLAERTFSAGAARAGTLQFADGSVVTLAPGARARVLAKDPTQAQVTVAEGRVRFAVHHGGQTHWQVVAGPFRVHVTGTAFTVDWSPQRSAFLLVLTEGSVRVEGAGVGAGLPLQAGQTLTADVQTGEIHVARDEREERGPRPAATASPQPHPEPQLIADQPAAPVVSATAVPPSGPVVAPPSAPPQATPRQLLQRDPATDRPAQTTPPPVAPEPLPTAPPPHPSHADEQDPAPAWAALLTAGDYRAIIDAAETMGIERCQRRCSPAAQMSLADAARYRGRIDLARRMLDALVEGDARAAEIARAHYVLGQIAEGEGAHLAAIEAYRLCETADGPGAYGALALGRTMRLWTALGDSAAARQVAARYLQRFPTGPFAQQAHTLVNREP